LGAVIVTLAQQQGGGTVNANVNSGALSLNGGGRRTARLKVRPEGS